MLMFGVNLETAIRRRKARIGRDRRCRSRRDICSSTRPASTVEPAQQYDVTMGAQKCNSWLESLSHTF